MASEHNSKLIDKLYQVTMDRKAEDVLQEMEEIKDPVFIYPIFSAYKKFKDASNSHYFISALNDFGSKEVLPILLEIASGSDVSPKDFTWSLIGLLKFEYKDEKLTTKAQSVLLEFVKEDTNLYLPSLLGYLEKNNALSEFDISLQTVFENEEFNLEDRVTTLDFLLRSNPKKWIGFYIENHKPIKNTSNEILLTKTLLTWKGPLVEEFKKLILKEGGARARELVEASQKREQQKANEEEKKESISFSNSKLVSEIVILRSKINLLAKASPAFGGIFFPPNESIHTQLEVATTEDGMRSKCAELRAFFQDLEDTQISQHGVTFEDAKQIIPGLSEQDFNKSINKLHLLLRGKGIDVDSDLCGLKSINRVVNLLVHPEHNDEAVKLLGKLSGAEFFKREDWSGLHKFILSKYISFLQQLQKKLTQ